MKIELVSEFFFTPFFSYTKTQYKHLKQQKKFTTDQGQINKDPQYKVFPLILLMKLKR